GLSALASDGERLTLRSGPTTKVPRKEAYADHGRQGPERAGLDGLDQRVGGAVAHLARGAGQLRGGVLGGVGVVVDEALGRVDRVVDGLAAFALDGVDGAVHPVAGVIRHGVGDALELRLQRIDFLDQILAGDGMGRAIAHRRPPGCGGISVAANAPAARKFQPSHTFCGKGSLVKSGGFSGWWWLTPSFSSSIMYWRTCWPQCQVVRSISSCRLCAP